VEEVANDARYKLTNMWSKERLMGKGKLELEIREKRHVKLTCRHHDQFVSTTTTMVKLSPKFLRKCGVDLGQISRVNF